MRNFSVMMQIIFYGNREIKVPEVSVSVQFVMGAMSNRFSNNHMCFNTAKCKYMAISRKRNGIFQLTTLCGIV